ncbi:MAG: hypothetical protein V1932_06130 [Chloroflexota bacterium]
MMNLLIELRQRLQRALLAPVLEQNERLLQRQEESLQANSRVLEQFTAAISDCAEQLARHTDAVKGIASASQELLDVVCEMNKMLRRVSVDEESEGQAKGFITENLSSRSETRNS